MITKRFQAWRIASTRAWEFHRTYRPAARPTPMLLCRTLGRCDDFHRGVYYLAMPAAKTRRRFRRGDLVHCRPKARGAPFLGPFRCGPVQCVQTLDNPNEFYSDARPYPRGRPPCAPAAHWLAANGYLEIPF